MKVLTWDFSLQNFDRWFHISESCSYYQVIRLYHCWISFISLFLFGMTTCSTSRWFPPKFFSSLLMANRHEKVTLGIRMNVFSQSFQANLHVMDGNALFLTDWSKWGRFWIYAGVHLVHTLTKGLHLGTPKPKDHVIVVGDEPASLGHRRPRG